MTRVSRIALLLIIISREPPNAKPKRHVEMYVSTEPRRDQLMTLNISENQSHLEKAEWRVVLLLSTLLVYFSKCLRSVCRWYLMVSLCLLVTGVLQKLECFL